MKVLVTADLDFIGSHSAVELQNTGFEGVIIDNLWNFFLAILDGISLKTAKVRLFIKSI